MQKHFIDTIIVGTGCAGYNAADCLHALGRRDIAIVTEGRRMGTSRNTGSDKQTYYKLSLAGDEHDSVRDLAQTLFAGGGMHGDTALIEAAGSARAFMKLVELGVPFPTNQHGEYVGYQTDHDKRRRATSAGPLTSKYMTEALEQAVKRRGIRIMDGLRVIQLLVKDNAIRGLVGVDAQGGYTAMFCNHMVLATGGPAGLYAQSVFPPSQTGALGLAVNAGLDLANLQEWQYGIASVRFRWNLSGSYQQVLPKYISVDAQGRAREFLTEHFGDPMAAVNRVFLKGYEWPFDSAKAAGSSEVDLLLHREIHERGRRVFLDYRENPTGLDFTRLSPAAREHLENCSCLFGTPIERLAKMNPKAIELYRSNGIDLHSELLEAAVCAQHHNGGIAVDHNWQTSCAGLYAAGECAGTFGVYRPGGSALNATQVGSRRAAEHIAQTPEARPEEVSFDLPEITFAAHESASETLAFIREEMSRTAGYLRDAEQMQTLLAKLTPLRARFFEQVTITKKEQAQLLFITYDTLCAATAVLRAMIFSAEQIGTRGSAMIGGRGQGLGVRGNEVTITCGTDTTLAPVRPMPEDDSWFEAVWNR